MAQFKAGMRVYRSTNAVDGKFEIGEEGTVLKVNPSGSLAIQMDGGHYTPNGSSKRFNVVGVTVARSSTRFNVDIKEMVLVNGVDIEKMSDDELFGVIADAEKEIKRLDGIGTKPQKLEARIEELKAQVQKVVDLIDSRD